MSFDTRARSAAEAASVSVRGVNPMTGLAELQRVDRSRRRGGAALAVGVLAAVVAGGAWFASSQLKAAAPTTPVPGATASHVSTAKPPCDLPLITCLGGNRYRVALVVPVTVTLPSTFQGAWIVATSSLEDYRNDVPDGTGVSILEGMAPARDDASWTRDPTAGTTAASVARWLSERPFLRDTTLQQTTVGGRPAWRVTGQLKPGAALPAQKNGTGQIAPTFTGGGPDTPANRGYGGPGYAPNLTGDYTLLDLPGAGLTVIWSWSTNPQHPALAGNQAYIDGLSFS
jgi:hypothetical protein